MKTAKQLLVALALVLTACGAEEEACNPNPSGVCQYNPDQESSPAKAKEKAALSGKSGMVGDYYVYKGYVSPLNIEVNGVSYVDSEEFYSHEVKRLKAEAKENYPDYQIVFDANIGLRDFKKGMSAFLVASNDIGLASEATVDGSGKFSFTMLSSDLSFEDMYTIRVTKRISVRMIKGKDEIKICYNMYAQSDVSLDKPIILRSFATSETEYDCGEESKGIQLPAKEPQAPVEKFPKDPVENEDPVESEDKKVDKKEAAKKEVKELVDTLVANGIED